MTQEEFNRMLMSALREPKIQSAVVRVINESTAKARRAMVARDVQRATRVSPQGGLVPKGKIRAVTPR